MSGDVGGELFYGKESGHIDGAGHKRKQRSNPDIVLIGSAFPCVSEHTRTNIPKSNGDAKALLRLTVTTIRTLFRQRYLFFLNSLSGKIECKLFYSIPVGVFIVLAGVRFPAFFF